MGLLQFQSPLSILGLKYSDNSSQAVKSAYKIAALCCHPDKRPGPEIPPTYFTLLKEAHDQLLSDELQLHKFKGYPVIFHPRDGNVGEPIFRIPKCSPFAVCGCGEIIPGEMLGSCNTQDCEESSPIYFIICKACKTPIPEEEFDRHLSQHTDICHICGEVMGNDHYSVRHPEKLCPLCPALNENDHHYSHMLLDCGRCFDLCDGPTILADHIRQGHFDCPLCGEECGDSFGDHFESGHKFVVEDCCSNNPDHYHKAHQWLQCPYRQCTLHITKGKLLEHMIVDHELDLCSECPRSEVGFIKDKTHLKSHESERCPECNDLFYISKLPHHMVKTHKWRLCLYCDRTEESEDELQEHIKEDHRLANCLVCQQTHLEEEIDRHLSDVHDWLKCSWCNKAFTEEELRTHIAVSHPPQEHCDCKHKDTIPGLKIHKMQSHAWQQCLYCENIEPPDGIEQHISSHQLMTCQECKARFLPTQERAHFQQTHQYVQCSFCEHFNSPSEMLIHVQSHLSRSRPQPNLESSISSAKVQDVREKEGPTRSYDSTKCALCRKRKRKCTFKDTNSECDRCLDRNDICPGRSERKKHCY